MTARSTTASLLLLGWFLGVLTMVRAEQIAKRLWVLREPDEVVEYDPATFAPKQTVKVPPQALRNPESFTVSSDGQMLFDPNPGGSENAAPGSAGDRLWLWNGQAAAFLDRRAIRTDSPAGANRSVIESTPRCFPATDGRSLYWLANEFGKVKEKDRNIELSVATTFRAWQSGPAGEGRVQIAEMSFVPCDCGTGVCEETCPEGEFWVPAGGILDFFFVTRWIPGQIGSTYLSSHIYRKSGERWSAQELPQAMESVLDAAQGGNIVVHAVLDGACCGWDNESSDMTILARNGRSVVLFNERERYANPNYDVSFFTSNAALSADVRFIAMTIVATAKPGADIRLSSEGKADDAELARIRRAIADLPAVEVLRLAEPPAQVFRAPRAVLVGWLSEKEILVVENHILMALDFTSGSRRGSQIRVPSETLVFLR